jgi:hypothetical protein
MTVIPLYRYERADGGITVSPTKPQSEYTELYRLIADEGKFVTKDDIDLYSAIDTDSVDGWREITEEEKQISDEEALAIIRGEAE